MTKVVIFTPFFLPHIGGMERAVNRIAVSLARHTAMEVVVHTSLADGTGVSRGHSDNSLTVIRTGDSLKEWSEKAFHWANLNERKVEIAIFTSFGPDTRERTGEIASLLRRVDVRTIWRTPTADHARRNLSGAHLSLLDGIDLVIANSRPSAERTANAIGRDVKVIPNMLFDDEVQSALVDATSNREADVAWIGRVTYRKRPDDLLAILNRLSAEYSVHIQASPSYCERRAFARFVMGLSERVVLHAPSLRQPEELLRASTMVHLSEVEGSPNSVLEAAVRGTAVLASDIPECAELLRGTMHDLVPTADPDVCIEKVSRLHAQSTTELRVEQHALIRRRHGEREITAKWCSTICGSA